MTIEDKNDREIVKELLTRKQHMRMQTNVFLIAGACFALYGAFWLHPGLGLLVIGILLLAVGAQALFALGKINQAELAYQAYTEAKEEMRQAQQKTVFYGLANHPGRTEIN